MNRHVGASFTLSVLVVVFFAVILYEPEHARRPGPPARPAAGTPSAGPETTASAPPPTPGVPLVEATSEAVPEPGPATVASTSAPPPRAASPIPDPSPRVTGARPRPPGTAAGQPTMIHAASNRRPLPPARRSAFTQVADGESLADVAIRVYGTSDAAGNLWRANRDIIDRRDASLQAGTLLRTP